MKNRDILLDAIGAADEGLVPALSEKQKPRKLRTWIALGGLCAAALLCVLLIPKKSQGTASGINAAFRYTVAGGIDVVDERDLARSEPDRNPWDPALRLSALPVYRNPVFPYYVNFVQSNYTDPSVAVSGEEMERIVRDTAAALHVEILDEEKTLVKNLDVPEKNQVAPPETSDYVNEIRASCSGQITITVSCYGETRIEFDGRPALPGLSASDGPAERSEKLLVWLSETYPALLGYDDPVCYSTMDGVFYVFQQTGDPVQDILNYRLHTTRIDLYGGSLFSITPENYYLSHAEYLGDYPVISVEQATEALLCGDYYCRVPDSFLPDGKIHADRIFKTELMYSNGIWESEYFLPYYRFYVLLDPNAINDTYPADGLQRCGVFYVPAVDLEREITHETRAG